MMNQKKPSAQAFIIVMSRGDNIKVDGDEIALVLDSIQKGSPCKLRQAIFNPSFYVNIVEDTERLREWRQKNMYIVQHNKQDELYADGKKQQRYVEMRSLKDIFAEVPLKLGDGVEPKELT